MQLATPDEHGPHLRHLAGVSAQTVGLGVDDKELRGRERLFE